MRSMTPTTNHSLASRMRPLYFHCIRYAAVFKSLPRFSNPCRGFQIPAAIPNTINMISNFSNNPLSITSRQSIHRNLCAIRQEGKPEPSIAAKQRTLGSERKTHRIRPSTSRTFRPCSHAPAARHHPDSSSIPTRKDGVS